MAEIKVQIKGDDSDIKAKFRETSAEARMFQESVSKSMEAVSAASKNVVSETGLGGIAKLLGGAGLAGAAVEFSSRIVDGFKNAVNAALDFGKQVSQLRSALGVAFGGQAEEWAERIRGISGAMGGFEENMAVFKGLLRGGMIPQDAYTNLINIQNAAKALGIGVDELGEKFAEMKERGELPERFFRQFPALAPIVRAMGGGEHPSVDWMFKTLLPAVAPGGLQAPGRIGAEQSIRGQILSTQEQFNKQWVALGRDLLPIVNTGLKELKDQMPNITGAFKALGEELTRDVPRIVNLMHDVFGTGERLEHPKSALGQTVRSIDEYFQGVETRLWEMLSDPAKLLKEAAQEQKEANSDLHRIVNPK